MKTLDNRFYVKSMQLEIGLLYINLNTKCPRKNPNSQVNTCVK